MGFCGKLIYSLIVLYLAFIVKLFFALDVYRGMEFKSDDDARCSRLPTQGEPKDMVVYGEFILSAIDSRKQLFFEPNGVTTAPQGEIVSIDIIFRKSTPVEIRYFPQDIGFHPHGMYVKDSYLYVVNHAFSKGGERLEKFYINTRWGISLDHVASIQLPSELAGTISDILVIDDHKFIATQWVASGTSFPLSEYVNSYYRMYKFFFGSYAAMLECNVNNNKAMCKELDYGQMLNGIVKVGDKIFVADTLAKQLLVYNTGFNLFTKQVHSLSFHPDHLTYSEADSAVYIAGYISNFHILSRMTEQISIASGSIARFNLKSEIVKNVLSSSSFSCISSVVPFRDWYILGSWDEKSAYLCPR
jgi:hypothetical protein